MNLFVQQHNGILWSHNHELMLVEPWGRDSIRVRATQLDRLLEMPGALLPAEHTPAGITIGDREATLCNGRLSAIIAADGGIRFVDERRRRTGGGRAPAPLAPFHRAVARELSASRRVSQRTTMSAATGSASIRTVSWTRKAASSS